MINQILYAGLIVMLFFILAISKNEFVLFPLTICLSAYIKETFIPMPFRIIIRKDLR